MKLPEENTDYLCDLKADKDFLKNTKSTNHKRKNDKLDFIQIKNFKRGTSLVAQWLRIHLPMQGTWV